MSKDKLKYEFRVTAEQGYKMFEPNDAGTHTLVEGKRYPYFNGGQFNTYKEGDKQLIIERNNAIIDTGIIGYRGAHGGDVFFLNLANKYEDGAFTTPDLLHANAFKESDIIKIQPMQP